MREKIFIPFAIAFGFQVIGYTATPAPVPYDADLFSKDKKGPFFNVEFLYWLVNEGGLDYAVKMDQPAWSTEQQTCAIGNYQNGKFDWSPGIRVSVGYFNAPHYWDMFAQYTYLPSSGRNHTHAPEKNEEFLNGTWIQPDVDTNSPPFPLLSASSHLDFTYHLLDLLCSRRFNPNEHLRINLFGGITSGLLYQKWKIDYKDTADQYSHIRHQWRFEGIGARIGLKVDWFLGWDLYLTGITSTAILSGWYKNSAFQKTSALIANANSHRPIRDTQFHDSRLAYQLQLLTGISWQKAFDKVRAEIFAGYEWNGWANLHEVYHSTLAAPTGAKETWVDQSPLSLQGLTTRIGFSF